MAGGRWWRLREKKSCQVGRRGIDWVREIVRGSLRYDGKQRLINSCLWLCRGRSSATGASRFPFAFLGWPKERKGAAALIYAGRTASNWIGVPPASSLSVCSVLRSSPRSRPPCLDQCDPTRWPPTRSATEAPKYRNSGQCVLKHERGDVGRNKEKTRRRESTNKREPSGMTGAMSKESRAAERQRERADGPE